MLGTAGKRKHFCSPWQCLGGNIFAWRHADSIAERYLDLLKNAKVKGYLFEQQNYFSKKEGEEQ